MNEELFGDIAVEKTCQDRFGIRIDVVEVVARGIQSGPASQATIFRVKNGQVWMLITSQSPLLLDDVQKMVHRMNVEAEAYCPPYGEKDYFARIGREKFQRMFPGKPVMHDDDLRYYKKLAPYNPALIRLSRIKGEIKAYDIPSKSWHKVREYTYSKIKTI